jgi:hypothetical protein
MDYCEIILCQDARTRIQVTEEDRDRCHQILSQVSPSLLRILQAIAIITSVRDFVPFLIFKVHAVLDFSWDELRMAFCSLRSLILHEGEGLIRIMPIVALDMTLSPVPFLWDLTCGYLRVMRRILSGEVDRDFERVSIYVQLVPYSSNFTALAGPLWNGVII